MNLYFLGVRSGNISHVGDAWPLGEKYNAVFVFVDNIFMINTVD